MKYLHHTPNRKLWKYLYQLYVHLVSIRAIEEFSDNKVLNRYNSFWFPRSMHNWELLNFSCKNLLFCYTLGPMTQQITIQIKKFRDPVQPQVRMLSAWQRRSLHWLTRQTAEGQFTLTSHSFHVLAGCRMIKYWDVCISWEYTARKDMGGKDRGHCPWV